jgi:hypothetical protein
MVCDKIVWKMVGVKVVMAGGGGGGIQNQKQEPHTKMWGKSNKSKPQKMLQDF